MLIGLLFVTSLTSESLMSADNFITSSYWFLVWSMAYLYVSLSSHISTSRSGRRLGEKSLDGVLVCKNLFLIGLESSDVMFQYLTLCRFSEIFSFIFYFSFSVYVYYDLAYSLFHSIVFSCSSYLASANINLSLTFESSCSSSLHSPRFSSTNYSSSSIHWD